MAVLIAPACTPASVSGATPPGGGGNGAAGGGGPNGGGGSGPGIISTQPPAPRDAGPPATGKACGNSVIDISQGENCDDGNTDSGDGCNRICQTEANWNCPTPGQKCENLAKCGNSILTSDETCDDGNTVGGDGCSANCKTVEPGWQCRVPGKPCSPACGDGVITAGEICDDGNTANGDGCSAICKLEMGFKCTGSSGGKSICSPTVCGDGKREGAEGCDDGNTVPNDGCSPTCHFEPNCSSATGTCTSKCGDGLVVSEDCDDGNTNNGDGCSSTCKTEPGFQCAQPDSTADTMTVPITYRDFLLGGDFHDGSIVGSNGAVAGLVQGTLDSEGKPVFAGAAGAGHITSADTFKQWYRDVPGTNTTYVSRLTLHNNGNGGFVNRWGADGAQWNLTETAYYCGNVGEEMLDATGQAMPCTSKYQVNSPTECMTKLAAGETMLKCYVDGTTYKATFIVSKVDGNPLFFPVDNIKGMITPTSAYQPGMTPPMYSGNWTNEPGTPAPQHNFSFTSEVRYWFSYSTSKKYTLDFTGDDDVWVFVNRKLAVDLGGIHTPVEGQIVLNATGGGTVTVTPTEGAACKTQGVVSTCTGAQSKVDLGMSNNGVYEIVVFQAERAWWGSTYKLTLSGFNDLPSACTPACGDGITVADEECDCGTTGTGPLPAGCPGPNDDNTYGGCTTKCTWGGFCGDNIVNGPEECDEGPDNGTQYGGSGCTLGCTKAHTCGDNVVDTAQGEECDLGAANGGNLCTDKCKLVIQQQ
jgi:fibro-slime domain-containing protein